MDTGADRFARDIYQKWRVAARVGDDLTTNPDIDAILGIPEVPSDIQVAASIGKLIPFVGAGVSQVAGCPGWEGLADEAMRNLAAAGKINFAHLEQTRSLPPRVRLSLARSLARDKLLEIDFRTLLHPGEWKRHPKGRRIYTALSSISKSFITTNYDEWLDDDLGPVATPSSPEPLPTATLPQHSRIVFHRPEDLTISNLNRPGAVLHLHGSLKASEGMIMTTPEYLRHYAHPGFQTSNQKENTVLTFLSELFRLRTVLFVGYSMADLEILEYIILKRGPTADSVPRPHHCILQGYFTYERDLMLGMREYFRAFGVELIPYSRDQRDRDQLVEVLESFASQLSAAPLAISQELADMEALLNE